MNRFEPAPSGDREADIDYLDGEFRVRRRGSFVRCAISGEPIRLEDLRYWSVDRQEAYASPEHLLKGLGFDVLGEENG